MLTRRAALLSAAVAALLLAVPATTKAADDLKLPRQKVELVAPPFVHAHEQATKQGPKIMEFTHDDRGEEGRHRRRRHHVPGHDLQRLDAGPADGRA